MDKRFSMTPQQGSWHYGIPEESILRYAERRSRLHNWYEQEICCRDDQGQLWRTGNTVVSKLSFTLY